MIENDLVRKSIFQISCLCLKIVSPKYCDIQASKCNTLFNTFYGTRGGHRQEKQ